MNNRSKSASFCLSAAVLLLSLLLIQALSVFSSSAAAAGSADITSKKAQSAPEPEDGGTVPSGTVPGPDDTSAEQTESGTPEETSSEPEDTAAPGSSDYPEEEEVPEINLDYSDGDEAVTIGADELVGLICGSECGDAEKAYLSADPRLVLKYSPAKDPLAVILSGRDGTITASASALIRTGSNGIGVLWIPQKAVFGELEQPFGNNGDGYSATFTDVPEADSYSVTVIYSAEIYISPEIAGIIANKAFNDASGEPSATDSPALESLREEIAAGRLVKREVPSDDTVITVESVVEAGIVKEDIGDYPVITFRNYDGTILCRIRVKDGGIAEENIPVPTLPEADSTVKYVFNGWRTEDGRTFGFGEIGEDAVLVPDVSEKNVVYKVTFVTAAGSETKEYGYGDIPSYSGKTSKPEDGQFYYVFLGWDRPFEAVTGDAVYTAVYSSEERYYTVKWILKDRSYTESVCFGTVPECPVNPEAEGAAPSESEIFTFIGWDKTPEAVTGSAVYTAKYSAEWIVPASVGGNESGLGVKRGEKSVTLSAPAGTGRIDLSGIAAEAIRDKLDIIISYDGGISAVLGSEYLSAVNVRDGLVFELGRPSGSGADTPVASVSVFVGDSSGKEISAEGVSLSFPVPEGTGYAVYAIDGTERRTADADLSSGRIAVTCSGGVRGFEIVKKYKITVAGNGNGSVSLSLAEAAAGESVAYEAAPADGFTVGKVLAAAPDGTVTEISGGSFTMPAHDIQITCEFTSLLCTVTFYSEGEVFRTVTGRYGDVLTVPADVPEKRVGSGSFVFDKWSPDVPGTFSGDASFNAVFREADKVKDREKSALPFWIVLVGVLLLGAATYVVIRAYPQKKKQ